MMRRGEFNIDAMNTYFPIEIIFADFKVGEEGNAA